VARGARGFEDAEYDSEPRPAPFRQSFVGNDYEHDAAETQLDALIRQVQAILARAEGVLLQLTIGDKGSYMYAAFAAPIVHEDDPRRAVRVALELQRAATTLGFLEPVQKRAESC
jgi:hypothetical protein